MDTPSETSLPHPLPHHTSTDADPSLRDTLPPEDPNAFPISWDEMSPAECEIVRRQAHQTRGLRKFGEIATSALREAKGARADILLVRKEVREGFKAQRDSIGDMSENMGRLASDGARQQKEHQTLKQTIAALTTKRNAVILFATSLSYGLASHAGQIFSYVVRHLP